MARYRPIYKCGLCGMLLKIPETLNVPESEAEKQIARVIWRNEHFAGRRDLNPVAMYIPHNCTDGSCGVAQFIGIKKE